MSIMVLCCNEERGRDQEWNRRELSPKRDRALVGSPRRRVGSRVVDVGRKVNEVGTSEGVGKVV